MLKMTLSGNRSDAVVGVWLASQQQVSEKNHWHHGLRERQKDEGLVLASAENNPLEEPNDPRNFSDAHVCLVLAFYCCCSH